MTRADLHDISAEVMTSTPLRPKLLGWQPERVVLTRGCDASPPQQIYCERLIAAFPEAEVIDRRDVPHNRLSVPGDTQRDRLKWGKATLVLGSIGRPLHINRDPEARHGVLCAPYLAYHTSWFCFYDCAYCYLAGSPGVKFSPTVRIFTNVGDVLAQMFCTLEQQPGPVGFYSGKVQDGLQLDPITNSSRILIPALVEQPNARLIYLTKSAAVENLLELARVGQAAGQRGTSQAGRLRYDDIVVTWSLNADEIVRTMERGTASLRERLTAAARCKEAGYEVRFVVMPLVPFEGWEAAYDELLEQALAVGPSQITLGGICSYPGAARALRENLGADNPISPLLTSSRGCRARYPLALRVKIYRHLLQHIRSRSDLPVSLCLETLEAWEQVGLDPRTAHCNCMAGACDLTAGAS